MTDLPFEAVDLAEISLSRWQSYSEYKASGIEGLGEIPSHWKLLPLRRGIQFLTDFEANGSFSDIRDSAKINVGEPFAWYVRATDLENKRYGFTAGNHYCDKQTFDYLRKTSLQGGELLVAKRGEIGKVYLMPYVDIPATLAPNLYLIRLIESLSPSFAYLWFLSEFGRRQLELANKSTTIGALYKNDVKAALCIFPSVGEQRAISDFLERETSKFDALIAKKRELITLLQEQRSALISHAVTKGLNPDVPMKESGIEWLGDIPVHWQTTPIKYVCSVVKDGLHETPPKVETGKGVPFISTQHVRNRSIALEDVTYISYEDYRRGHPRTGPKPGDVFITLVGSIGFSAIIKADMFPISCTRHVGYVRPKAVLNAMFLLNYVESKSFKAFIQLETSQVAQPSIYLSSLSEHVMSLPSYTEQCEIVAYLERETEKIDRLISKTEETIIYLQEYRSALISAAVTGKIDVRGEVS